MTVYVDNMRLSAQVGTISGRWSHLMADSDDELDEFAAKLGLKKAWAQHPGTALSHYDVTESKRQQAIALGAVPIDYGGDISIASSAVRARLHLSRSSLRWRWTRTKLPRRRSRRGTHDLDVGARALGSPFRESNRACRRTVR